MSIRQWLQPPRSILLIFLGIMSVCGGALGWLGWQLLEQDRSLERQRVQERLEKAADDITSQLQRSLADIESYLSFIPGTAAKQPPDGVAVLLATARAVNAYPPGRLLLLSRDSGRGRPTSRNLR